jgi:hypothetical protein
MAESTHKLNILAKMTTTAPGTELHKVRHFQAQIRHPCLSAGSELQSLHPRLPHAAERISGR